jgi:tetratricopeptide (TPR) repeat protein
MDYLVYAYLQEGKDASARSVLAEMSAMTALDDNQFQAAYAFAASPARWALEQHDWKAASALEVKPAWFPWDRFRNAEALVHYARAIGAGRAGDAGAAHRATDEIAAIRRLLPQTRDYDWAGSIGAQWETANALATYAEGKKAEAIRLLRAAADHEDAVDKHPVTPGALLPAREILADLLLESGFSRDALREYEAVLKIAPRRFNATAGAAKAAAQAGDVVAARAYAKQLLEIAAGAESPRPELLWARGFLQQK